MIIQKTSTDYNANAPLIRSTILALCKFVCMYVYMYNCISRSLHTEKFVQIHFTWTTGNHDHCQRGRASVRSTHHVIIIIIIIVITALCRPVCDGSVPAGSLAQIKDDRTDVRTGRRRPARLCPSRRRPAVVPPPPAPPAAARVGRRTRRKTATSHHA